MTTTIRIATGGALFTELSNTFVGNTILLEADDYGFLAPGPGTSLTRAGVTFASADVDAPTGISGVNPDTTGPLILQDVGFHSGSEDGEVVALSPIAELHVDDPAGSLESFGSWLGERDAIATETANGSQHFHSTQYIPSEPEPESYPTPKPTPSPSPIDIPAAPLALADTVEVGTLEDLYAALAAADGGETILLEGGEYGALYLGSSSGFSFAFPENVTITSADPGNPARFSQAQVSGAENLTFDGIVFDYDFAPGDPSHESPFVFSGGHDVAIRNSVFDGDNAAGVSAIDDGYGWGIGLSLSSVDNATLEGNEIFGFHRGLVMDRSTGGLIIGNDVHSIRSDGMDFVQVQDILIENNHIHDFRGAPNSPDHRDMIQFWTAGTTEATTDVTIRGNLLDIGQGDWAQSIFIGNEIVGQDPANLAMYYRNFTIEENVIINAHLHGITVGGMNGLKILNNTVLHADGANVDGPDTAVEIPSINVDAGSKNVLISQNATSNVVGYTDQPGWTVLRNVLLQDQDPAAPGYYGNVFYASTLTETGGAHRYVALPDSPLHTMEAGAAVTRTGGEALTRDPMYHFTSDPADPATRTFDATASLTEKMAVGTIFEWSFGDGTTAEGVIVSHTYTAGGRYDVTLKITQPGLPSETRAVPVPVSNPEILAQTTDGFIASEDGLDVHLAMAEISGGILEIGGPGNRASVDRSHVAELLGSEEVTLAFTLKADSAASVGEVVRLHTSFDIHVDAEGELIAQFFTQSNARIVLTSDNADLANGTAHDVDVVMKDGKLQIWIDGEMTAQTEMPGLLGGVGGRELLFGNPWTGLNFDGELSNFRITKDASDYPSVAETIVIRDTSATDTELLSFEAGQSFVAHDSGVDTPLPSPGQLTEEGLKVGPSDGVFTVSRDHVDEVFGADEFGVTFSIRASSAQSAGEIFNLGGSLIVGLDANGNIVVTAQSEALGKVLATAASDDLRDQAAHEVGLRMENGHLEVWVDGNLATIVPLGGPLSSAGTGALTFGTPSGSATEGFFGLVKAFSLSLDAGERPIVWNERGGPFDPWAEIDLKPIVNSDPGDPWTVLDEPDIPLVLVEETDPLPVAETGPGDPWALLQSCDGYLDPLLFVHQDQTLSDF